MSTTDVPHAGLAQALHGDGPAPDRTEELMLFGRFVGSWDVAWSGFDDAGREAHALGELHFGWVLGGRAVQDVWIVPGPGEPGEGQPPLAFHGSTIRFYDRKLGAWRSTWMDPVNGTVRRFIGRPAGDEIILLSDEQNPQLRWRFTEITAASFRWRSEISHDHGNSWTFNEDMRLTRRNHA